MKTADHLIDPLPDPESARRFLARLTENHPKEADRLIHDEAFCSDVLTLSAYSPLIAETLLQNPDYLGWLKKERQTTQIRAKEDLLESLARFSLTNSQVAPEIVFARFRRRELIRIFLADIRQLRSIAEITEELSNLADAVLERALVLSRQEIDNRYGHPLEKDKNDRKFPAELCIVSLGKLGSRELNYASDIDLLFVYSGGGETSGAGRRGKVTNHEYFVKVAEQIVRLIGRESGEGSAYRVDLRLRPYGGVGALAMSLEDTVKYYLSVAADWERQVLIRSRPSAGNASIFQAFSDQVSEAVFSAEMSADEALRSVRLSKQRIDLNHDAEKGFDVKLGKGGIREIEFIAQALQLAFGGKDKWLRSSHTLISLSRLNDRRLITAAEHSQLSEAYVFLRRVEHILQMENGLQTHLVPSVEKRMTVLAKRMGYAGTGHLKSDIERHTSNVHQAFRRIFNFESVRPGDVASSGPPYTRDQGGPHGSIAAAGENTEPYDGGKNDPYIQNVLRSSNRLSLMAHSDPKLVGEIPRPDEIFEETDLSAPLDEAVFGSDLLGVQLGALRKAWTKQIFRIMAFDAAGKLSVKRSRYLQTQLAEAAMEAALEIARKQGNQRFSTNLKRLSLTVIGLGKLGGAGIDHGSDLDLIMVYDDDGLPTENQVPRSEFYARIVETFVIALSGVTREGSMYRVDLRLRPHGKNGPIAISAASFEDYIHKDAATWELLALLKIRAVGGDRELGGKVETRILKAIYQRASEMSAVELAKRSRSIRDRLEAERSAGRAGRDIDIKFGPGGMMDIYFAIRFLQLRDGIQDDPSDRSTEHMIDLLFEKGSLTRDEYENLSTGYRFLSTLDHQLRVLLGRSTLLPTGSPAAMNRIASGMGANDVADLLELLTERRIGIRESYESVFEIG